MQTSSKKAFTMIELVFVIVVIGILSAIAIPKFAATRDDALITKGLATLASVRSSIATERQKKILRGDFSGITSLRGTGSGVFSTFNDANGSLVLEYDVESCTDRVGCWNTTDGVNYTFKTPTEECKYQLLNNRFVDNTDDGECTEMK
jgi:general secretion pathway protein G